MLYDIFPEHQHQHQHQHQLLRGLQLQPNQCIAEEAETNTQLQIQLFNCTNLDMELNEIN